MKNSVLDSTHSHDILATARWGDSDYMAELYPYEEKNSFWLGRNPHNPYQAIGYAGEGHVFLAAGSRSGKGRSIIINNLIKWPGSLVSIDPKGLNASIAAIRRGPGNQNCSGMEQDVYVLDPMNCANVPDELRAHYNLLDALDPNSGELSAQADLIADAVCVIPKSSEAAEWAEEGREFISIIIQWVVCSPYIQNNDRNLLTVRNLIMEGEHERSVELQAQGIIVDPYQILLDDMKDSKANNGRIARQARDWQQSVKDLKKYYESIRKSAIRHLKFLNTDGMENTISNTGVYPRTLRLSDLRTTKNGISIFLCLPPQFANPYGRWQRAMINLMLAEMQAHYTKPDNGHSLLVSIDEFPLLGRMDKIIDVMNFIGESGIKLFIACQHIINLKDIYGDNFEQFIAGSKVQIWFAPGGKYSGEYLSQMLGETEVIKYQRNINKQETTSQTDGKTDQESFTESESSSLAKGINTSRADNSSHTDNWSTSDSQTRGTNKSQTDNWSAMTGWNKNWQQSKSKNKGTSKGKAAGRNYGPHIFFESLEHGTNYDTSSSNTRGTTSSSGEGGGINESLSEGGASTSGHSTTVGNTNTLGGSDTRSVTNTYGQSETQTIQAGISNTRSRGIQESHTQGESLGGGVTETFHKKPLLTVHEAEHFLKAVEDPNQQAFPGLALVKIQGELPFLVRKINYDQDSIFERCFNPHPSHPYIPYSKMPLLEYEYTEDYYIPIVAPKELIDKNYVILLPEGLEKGRRIGKECNLFSVKSPYSNQECNVRTGDIEVEVTHIDKTEFGESMTVRRCEKFPDPLSMAGEYKKAFLAKMWPGVLEWVKNDELEHLKQLEEAESIRKLEDAERRRKQQKAEDEAELRRLKEQQLSLEREEKKKSAWKSYMAEEVQVKEIWGSIWGAFIGTLMGSAILFLLIGSFMEKAFNRTLNKGFEDIWWGATWVLVVYFCVTKFLFYLGPVHSIRFVFTLRNLDVAHGSANVE